MIQIIGLREFTLPTGEPKKYETFFHKGWRAESLIALLANLDSHLAAIPGAERYDMFCTIAHCLEEEGRKFESQDIIPFDIDDIDTDRAEEYVGPVCKALGVPEDAILCIMSGHGLQIAIATEFKFFDAVYFDSAREHYRLAAAAIHEALTAAELPFKEVDLNMWSPARMFRLPGTLNMKNKESPVEVKIVRNGLRALPWSLTSTFAVSNEHLETVIGESVSEEAIRKINYFDTEGVVNECEFIRWTRDNPDSVSEPQWYAMLSVVSRLPEGRKLCHDLSSGHSSYSFDATELKIDQAIARSGPRTCDSIEKLFEGCRSCIHYRQVLSPISIKGINYIATIDTGFHYVTFNKDGSPKTGKPDFEGLRKFFEQKNRYISSMTGQVYTYTGTHWQQMPDKLVEEFALKHFKPLALDATRQEFRKLVQTTNIKDDAWFESSMFLNLQNGVLDLKTFNLLPHSHEFGFTYVLPYGYNPQATAPRFSQFLKEVTCNDPTLEAVLAEFMGYIVSNSDPSMYEKCLILLGDGSNGKSVFIDVLKGLVGTKNYCALTLDEVKKETNRTQLNCKLLNVAEETPYKGMTDSSTFKNLITGGEITVKELYHQPYRIKVRAKFVFACNELPTTYDPSDGMFRRLLIVGFNATFDAKNRDVMLRQKLLGELEGVFNIALEGYLRLQRQRGFTFSESSAEELDTFRESMDSYRQWASESIVEASGNTTAIQTLYNDYLFYCTERRLYPHSFAQFSKRIKKMFPQSAVSRLQVNGRRLQAITGIELLSKNKEVTF